MGRITQLTHEFVDSFPTKLEDGKLYVSVKFASATHKCCCGCGMQVVTPIAPVGWKLIFDGESITLEPSIGNWSFQCRSHYWITRNQVRWAESWSREEVEELRQAEIEIREKQYRGAISKPNRKPEIKTGKGKRKKIGKGTLLQRVKNWVNPD